MCNTLCLLPSWGEGFNGNTERDGTRVSYAERDGAAVPPLFLTRNLARTHAGEVCHSSPFYLKGSIMGLKTKF